MCSCINYNTFRKLNVQLTQCEVPKDIGADGGDLGSMGTVQLMLSIGTSKVTQDFIVCRKLRRNIIKWSSHSQKMQEPQAMSSDFREYSQKSQPFTDRREYGGGESSRKRYHMDVFRSQHANLENILKTRGGRVPKGG